MAVEIEVVFSSEILLCFEVNALGTSSSTSSGVVGIQLWELHILIMMNSCYSGILAWHNPEIIMLKLDDYVHAAYIIFVIIV